MVYEPHFKECPIEGHRRQDGTRVEVGGPGCECDYIQKMMERQAEGEDADRGREAYMEQLEQEEEEDKQLAADARHEEAELRRQEGITLESYDCGCRKENGALIIACQNHHEEWAERG